MFGHFFFAMGIVDLEITTLRIIGGSMRSRKIQFAVDPRTRPMKDRTRQALMNLLGGTFEEALAFDLFGGTGVLAFESISRGATFGVIFELVKSVSREIQTNAAALKLEAQTQVVQTDVLKWSQGLPENLDGLRLEPSLLRSKPWVVYCCPPYSLWQSQGPELHAMLSTWIELAPAKSLFAVELEAETDETLIPRLLEWDIRAYKPAKIAVGEKG